MLLRTLFVIATGTSLLACGDDTPASQKPDAMDAGFFVPPRDAQVAIDTGTMPTKLDAGFAPDTGVPFGGCAEITPEGTCQGNTVVYCSENDTVERIDCPVDFDPNAQCVEIDPTYGVDCALPAGSDCVLEDELGTYSVFCLGQNAGCLDTLDQAVCTENIGPCSETDELTCQGDMLIYACLVNQPWAIDCAALGTSCSSGICTGAMDGEYCDDVVVECGPGLSCDTNNGVCVSGGLPDGGVPTDGGVSTDSGVVADSGLPADAGPPPPDGGVGPAVTPSNAGDLVVTEIMQDPNATTDTAGEWIEIYNPSTTVSYNLNGCTLSDDGADNHTIANNVFLAPGAYVALARSASPGFVPDYVYSGFILSNTNDEVIVSCGGTVIDRVAYDNGATFPNPTGASMSLDPGSLSAAANDAGSAWCTAVTPLGADFGTPGGPNPSC